MSANSDELWPGRLEAPGLTPSSVRSHHFGRATLGRRGFDENEVLDFVEQVAEELARRDQREANARTDAERHKRALQNWSRDDAAARSKGGLPGNRPPAEVVNLMARTQQDCDRAITQTQAYCRSLAAEAEQHGQRIIDEARRQAADASEEAARAYRADSGPSYSPDTEDLRRRLAWMATFIESLGAAESQLSATRAALKHDLDSLFGRPSGSPANGSS